MLKTNEKKLVENVFTTYLEDRREQRETTYIYRTLIRYMKIQTAAVEHYSTRVLNGSRTQKWETNCYT